MEDPDGVSENMVLAAKEYAELVRARNEIEARIEEVKARIVEEMGPDMKDSLVDCGEYQVVCGSRSASRKVNVVALQRAGIKKEEFSTVSPSLRAFEVMAEARGWSPEKAAQFLIVSGERTPTVSVRRKNSDKESE